MSSKEYQVEERTRWECPTGKADARILSGPNLPKPLHGQNPRTFMGDKAWERVRKKAYFKANYKCEICGADCSNPGSMDCLERGTEVLTISGWKPIESITLNDSVAQFNPETEEVSFAHPTRVIEKYADELVSIGYKRGFHMSLTENHRVLLKNKKTGQWETVLAKDVPVGKWTYSIPTAGKGSGTEKLSVDEKVFIALQADGSLQYRRKTDGMYHFLITVKKTRKKEQLDALMRGTTFQHSKLNTKAELGYLTYSIDVPADCKKFSNVFEYSMSYAKATEFLDELVKWDGWKGARENTKRVELNCMCYYSSDKDNIDFVQAIAAQAGRGTHLSTSIRKSRKWGHLHSSNKPSKSLKVGYNLEIKKRAEHGTQTMRKALVDYHDSVFCLTVSTHYFIVRNKDDDVFITGNCHELYTVDYEKGTSTFVRVVAICKPCHNFYHSGRLLTLYKRRNPLYPERKVLEIIEHGLRQIYLYNEAHPDDKIKCYATIVGFMQEPELAERITKIVRIYEIEFWKEDEKKMAKWGDWKLIYGNKEYPTPYKSYEDWEKAMSEASKTDSDRQVENPFKGDVYDEINKLLG